MRYILGILFFLCIHLIVNGQIVECPTLVNFKASDCDSLILSKDSVKSEIISLRRFENGLINFKLTVGDNCGAIQNGILEVRGDTLNLIYDGKKSFKTLVYESDSLEFEINHMIESYAFCDYLFELTYEIQGRPGVDYVFMVNSQISEISVN